MPRTGIVWTSASFAPEPQPLGAGAESDDPKADRTLLSNDVCLRSNHRLLGGRGYSGVRDTLVPALREQGLGSDQVARLVTENPQRALSGQ